jgi:drug/metabolite transporter (DMT)-like permease
MSSGPFIKEIERVKLITGIGIFLIIVGVVALALQTITLTTDEKVAEVGPIEVTKETRQTIPLSPILGVLSLVGGLALVIIGSRRP